MSNLEDLRKATAAVPTSGERARIAAGPTVRYGGKPQPAPIGTVALSIGNGPVVMINEEDIRSVEEIDGFFVVEVPKGATVLIRQDQLVAAGETSCGCAGGGKVIKLEPSRADKKGRGINVVIEDLTVCDYHEYCLDFPVIGRWCIGITNNCTFVPGPL